MIKEKFSLGAKIEASVARAAKISGDLGMGTHWEWEHWKPASKRAGSFYLFDEWSNGNLCTDEGITSVLDTAFSQGSQKNDWYIAVFNDDYTPLESDTYPAPGSNESVAYNEGARVTWQEAGVAAKQITNAANRAVLTMNASETIFGGSLVSADTKGDVVSGEVLFCSAPFATEKDVENEDELKVTVAITGSNV